MMKFKTSFPFLAFLMLLCASCKENATENEPTAEPVFPTYFPLKTGNYWIYRQFDIDAAGNATASNRMDSCYIAKDTIIHQKTYFKVVKPPFYTNNPEISFLRDSLHYLVNHKGKILFTSEDFTSIFSTRYMVFSTGTSAPNDTIVKITSRMTDKDLLVATPAGIFATSSFQETYYHYPKHRVFSTYRYLNTRYSKNVGIVTESIPFFHSSPHSIERRLERFHLN